MIASSDILKASILIVDDQEANISLLEKMLRGAGYLSVASTMDPRQVCELHRQNHYSLILLDLEMPGLDGFQVMADLKAVETDGYLPVLAQTAQPHHKLRALKAGAKDFISKPFDLAEVLMRVHNLLEVRLLHLEAKLRTEQAETSAQRIRASELSYRRLFEAAQDGILILDVDTGRVNDVNPFLVQLLGFSRGEMAGKTVGELSPFKDIESNKVMLERLQKDGYVRYDDLPLETRDGRKIAVEFVSNVYQAGGRNVIQCNVRDITERKRTEEQLKASLKETGDLKSALDEHAIVATTDPQGKIIYVNDKFCAISKYSRAELLGQDHRILNSGHHSKEFIRELWTTITHGKVWRGEIKNMAKDGSFFWEDSTIVPFLNEQGQTRQYVAIRADITERKAAEERILQLNLELEQRVAARTAELQNANAELESFSYSVSHDLRAPLRHVMGFVDLLKKDAGPSLSEKGLRHLTTISQAAKRMGDLIDDLLAFSRVRQSEMRKTNVNLDQLVRETLGDFQAATQERNIVWDIHPLPAVRADFSLLRQVLVNLISNAVKFTGTRAQARIEIGCAPSGDGETVIFIRDNGAGFDPRYAHKLFGVFQRLHSQAEFEGTGIGLANVQRIIHRHGGRTWAEGVVDGGATFYFSIPKHNGDINAD